MSLPRPPLPKRQVYSIRWDDGMALRSMEAMLLSQLRIRRIGESGLIAIMDSPRLQVFLHYRWRHFSGMRRGLSSSVVQQQTL